jgi:peptidylprolyl isomerase
MKAVKLGDKVRVSVFAQAEGDDWAREEGELEFRVGEGSVNPEFDRIVEGMKTRERRSAILPESDLFGEHEPDLVVRLGRHRLPKGADPIPGLPFQLELSNGQELTVRVIEVSDDAVTVDANHPLAGRELRLDVTLLEILERRSSPSQK